MPHGEKCPHCGKKTWDWFLERILPPERSEIFKGLAAMDCPWCRRPVIYRRGEIIPASSNLAVYRRDYGQATRYALLKHYPTLEDFLLSPFERKVAAPFRLGYWPHIVLPFRKVQP